MVIHLLGDSVGGWAVEADIDRGLAAVEPLLRLPVEVSFVVDDSEYDSRLFLAIGLPVFRFRREIAFEDVRWFACRHDSSFRGRRA